jgi:hypothetical protein
MCGVQLKSNNHCSHYLLGLVRAGIAGDRSSGGLLSASCNLQLVYAEDPSCHQHIALSTNRLRIEYAEHAERTYIAEIAEIDEGPNTTATTTAITTTTRKAKGRALSLERWHKRLGHLNYADVKQLATYSS